MRADAEARVLLGEMLDRPGLTQSLGRRTARLLQDDPTGLAWAAEAERYVRACGCRTSALLAVIGGVGALGASAVWPSEGWLALALRTGGWTIAGFLVGAVLGKVLGLYAARLRFQDATRRMLGALAAPCPSSSSTI